MSHGSKRIHYLNTDRNSSFATQYRRKHSYTLFCKNKGVETGVLQGTQPITICDQFVSLFFCQLKSKTVRETFRITLDRLIHHSGFHTVKHCQITVNHDLFTTKGKYHLLNPRYGHKPITFCDGFIVGYSNNFCISIFLFCHRGTSLLKSTAKVHIFYKMAK